MNPGQDRKTRAGMKAPGKRIFHEHSSLFPWWFPFLIPLFMLESCAYDSVIREPPRAHKIYHHGDVPLSEKKEVAKERRLEAHTPLQAEEAGFFELKSQETENQVLPAAGKVFYVRRGAGPGPGHHALFFLSGLNAFEPLGRRLEPVCDVVYLKTPLPDVMGLKAGIASIELVRKNLNMEKIFLVAVQERSACAFEYAARYPGHTAGIIIISGLLDVQSNIDESLAAMPLNKAGPGLSINHLKSFSIIDYFKALSAECDTGNYVSANRCVELELKAEKSIKAFFYPGSEEFSQPSKQALSVPPIERAKGIAEFLKFKAVDLADKIKKIPVLVVFGENDLLAQREQANDLISTLANARIKIIRKAGQRPDLEKPGKVLEAITRILGLSDTLPPPSPSPLDLAWEPPAGLDKKKADKTLKSTCLEKYKKKVSAFCHLIDNDSAMHVLNITPFEKKSLSLDLCKKTH
ncbi:MAG: hypothetical protein GXP49_02625 [Deltaproteobacteria bacterium]|nr:hypothetical protein [Deltaproteobacteria bacterium]